MVATQILNKQERNEWFLEDRTSGYPDINGPPIILDRSVSPNFDCYANPASVLLYFNFIGREDALPTIQSVRFYAYFTSLTREMFHNTI